MACAIFNPKADESELSTTFGVQHSASDGLKDQANKMVGDGGLEPPTSPLSGVRSNHLS